MDTFTSRNKNKYDSNKIIQNQRNLKKQLNEIYKRNKEDIILTLENSSSISEVSKKLQLSEFHLFKICKRYKIKSDLLPKINKKNINKKPKSKIKVSELELRSLFETHRNLTQVAKQLNVSGNAVQKHCKKTILTTKLTIN